MFRHVIDSDTQLRLLEKRHAEELFALTDSCRPYLRKWLPFVDDTKTMDDTRKFIESGLRQLAENNGFHVGIWHRGKIAGCLGYHAINWPNRKTSIGYWLGEEYQGRGIMTAACKALVDHALKELKLNRVEIGCAVENRASRAIPKRLGFKEEGTLRDSEWLYDHFVDHVVSKSPYSTG
jgi:ribosomal-protein-serine acetyltransferase